MKHFPLVLLALFVHTLSIGQDCNLTLKGHVEDSDTKDQLTGATVLIRSLNLEITTDDKGNFNFPRLCKGTYTLEVTHVGCEPLTKTVELSKSTHLDLLLPHLKNNLSEVTVSATKAIASTGFKQELSGTKLEQAKGLSLADALAKINGITLLQTGATISKPVI
ncbi:MAG: carboxypeptidase-like regulatory domain-containing protein, partial [Chitinophagaceae bacterium]